MWRALSRREFRHSRHAHDARGRRERNTQAASFLPFAERARNMLCVRCEYYSAGICVRTDAGSSIAKACAWRCVAYILTRCTPRISLVHQRCIRCLCSVYTCLFGFAAWTKGAVATRSARSVQCREAVRVSCKVKHHGIGWCFLCCVFLDFVVVAAVGCVGTMLECCDRGL